LNTLLSTEKCSKFLPSPFTYSVKLFLKLGRALLIGPARNCHISPPVRLIIYKLFWVLDESFKIASCAAPRHISMVFAFEELLDGHFFLFNHLRTVLIRALLRDMCIVQCAQSSTPLAESAWQQWVALFNELRKQKLTNSFNYCMLKHYH